MALPHDSGGFLTGERLVSGMDAVKSDTDAILALLRAGMNRSGEDAEATRRAQEEIARNTRQTRDVGQREEAGGESDGTITRRAQEGGSRRRAPAPSPGAGPDASPEQARNERGQYTGDASPEQARNERGQYTGDGDGESDAKKQGWLSKMADTIKGRFGVGTPDADNVDPAVTAMQEAAQLMAPIAKVGGMLFGAGRWLLGKKRDDIPKEQRRHNKLIEKLLKKLVGEGENHGSGLFGGIFGSLTGVLGKIGPLLGMLGRGGLAGLGLVGAWLGGQAIGEWIYKLFKPQIDAAADAIGAAAKGVESGYNAAVNATSNWFDWLFEKPMTTEEFDATQPAKYTPGNTVGKDQYNAIMQEEYAKLGYSPVQMASLKGQLHTESGFNPDAIGPKGHFGMGQAGDAVAKKYNIIRGHTAEAVRSQVAGEAMYMKDLLAQFGGDWDKARAAYNWGPGNMQKTISKYGDDWRQHIPAETSDYLRKIKVYSSKYTSDFSAASPASPVMVKSVSPATKTISMPTPKSPAYPAGMGVLKIPPAPKIQQQVGGKDAAIPVVIQGSVSDISQNVSDRNLAHLITGGLGMDYRGQ